MAHVGTANAAGASSAAYVWRQPGQLLEKAVLRLPAERNDPSPCSTGNLSSRAEVEYAKGSIRFRLTAVIQPLITVPSMLQLQP